MFTFFFLLYSHIITADERRWLRTPEALILKRHLIITFWNLIRRLSWFPNTFTAHFFRTSTTNNEFFISLFNHSSPLYRMNFCNQLISSAKADISIRPISPVKFLCWSVRLSRKRVTCFSFNCPSSVSHCHNNGVGNRAISPVCRQRTSHSFVLQCRLASYNCCHPSWNRLVWIPKPKNIGIEKINKCLVTTNIVLW